MYFIWEELLDRRLLTNHQHEPPLITTTVVPCKFNIPGCEARNRENTDVCIAFMHIKSEKFLRFSIKLVKVIEVSLELMELN
jgi:predicted butyrate kinase (DUF1464 family)